jgi:hypothetical protein
MSKRANHWSLAVSLVAAVVSAVAVGTAGAVRSSPASLWVPAIGVRLHADLVPVGSAKGSGRFDALLVRTGPGQVRAARTLPGANTPPRGANCPPNTKPPIQARPCLIGGGQGAPPFRVPPVPPSGVHWTLVWRLSLTGVTGPASASIHLGAQGAASPILSTLCSACQALAKGHMAVTADQAQLFLKGNGYVTVQAASGQLSGQIVTGNHFFFSAPVRRASH